MNKKVAVLCLFLVLLLIVTLSRWETFEHSSGYIVQKDRLTSVISIHGFGEVQHQNSSITHFITVFIYSAIGVTVIALLKEIRITDSKEKE